MLKFPNSVFIYVVAMRAQDQDAEKYRAAGSWAIMGAFPWRGGAEGFTRDLARRSVGHLVALACISREGVGDPSCAVDLYQGEAFALESVFDPGTHTATTRQEGARPLLGSVEGLFAYLREKAPELCPQAWEGER